MDAAASLAALRLEIDALDERIIALLAERFEKTRAVGVIKAAIDEAPINPERQAHSAALWASLALKHGLDTAFANALYHVITLEVVNGHRRAGSRD